MTEIDKGSLQFKGLPIIYKDRSRHGGDQKKAYNLILNFLVPVCTISYVWLFSNRDHSIGILSNYYTHSYNQTIHFTSRKYTFSTKYLLFNFKLRCHLPLYIIQFL